MLATIDEIIYGRVLTGFALAVIVFQVVVLVMAARRRGRTPLPLPVHAVAGAGIAGLVVAVGISVHAARAALMAASSDAGATVMPVGVALAGQMNAIPFGISTTLLASTMWFVGLAFTLGARRGDGLAPALPPVALIAAGLLPVAYRALGWTTALIHQLASLTGSGDERVTVMSHALDVVRGHLRTGARVSSFAIPVLTVIAAGLIVVRDRKRAPGAPPARPAARRATLALTAAALAAAALLVVRARPMARENERPWPPPAVGERLNVVDPPTPDLVGPDALVRAPVVLIPKDRLGLDGTDNETVESLQEKLMTLRSFYRSLHPDAFFDGVAVILADPTTPMPRLVSVLQALRAEDYNKPLFVFTKPEVVIRPTLGRLQRVQGSGARAWLAYVGGAPDDDEIEDDQDAAVWKQVVTLRARDFPAYDAFARRLVALRREGKPVIVEIDRPR